MNVGDCDDDMITCPHCGHKEYPEVGMGSLHYCEGMRQAAEAENARIHAQMSEEPVEFLLIVKGTATPALLNTMVDELVMDAVDNPGQVVTNNWPGDLPGVATGRARYVTLKRK